MYTYCFCLQLTVKPRPMLTLATTYRMSAEVCCGGAVLPELTMTADHVVVPYLSL